MKKIIFLSLLLSPLILLAQFNGGNGDGFDNKRQSTFVNGLPVYILYSGGSGDGFSHYSTSSYLQGMSTAFMFSGGVGDGFSDNQKQTYINGMSTTILFNGGAGDGFSDLKYTGYLAGGTAGNIYNGGIGDGFDNSRYSGFTTGLASAMLYSGGQGDGFSHMNLFTFVNGLKGSVLYSGGDGDGFANANYFAIALPLKLISFNAAAKDKFVLVQWITENEEGTSYFTIERSASTLFKGLANVAASGSNTSRHTYNYTDSTPLPGRSYYRLQWTDKDGKKGYSDIRSVVFNAESKTDFVLFPNPNDGTKFNLQLSGLAVNQNVSVGIYDAQGKNVLQINDPTINGNLITVSLGSPLAKGNYVIKLLRNEQASSKILIVQ